MALKITEKNHQNYISSYINPDWHQATLHGLAARIGTADQNNLQFCHCCFHHINKTPISLCQDTKQVEFLGFGVPLYFAFVRNCIFLLLIVICCYSIPSLHYALIHNYEFCNKNEHFQMNQNISTILGEESPPHHLKYQRSSHFLRHFSKQQVETQSKDTNTTKQKSDISISRQIQCTGWMIYLSRIEDKVTTQQQLFRFAAFFIHFIFLIYIRDKLTKMKYYFDQRSLSPSDFAVFVKNMPPQTGQKKALQDFIKNQYAVTNIRNIILVPDLQRFQQLKAHQQILLNDLKKKVYKQKKRNNQIEQLQSKIKSKQLEIQRQIKGKKQLYKQDMIQAQRAVCIFETQDQKWNLIKKFKNKAITQREWSQLQITQASEPDQIIWENACIKNEQKRFFKFLGWFLSLLTLIFITAVFIVISHFKSQLVERKIEQYHENKKQKAHLFRQSFFLVMGMIFLVVLFNKFVMSHLFHKFTEIEKHSNTYKFQFYYCLKYCLGLFFTTALMTLIVQDFLYHNIFTHNFGVVEQETIMFLFNSIFVPFFWLVNPFTLVHKYRKWRFSGSKYVTQSQANKFMSDPSYDVGKRYGEVLQIMWFTFLYLTIIPVGAIFSCIGLIIYYWVDKYNLLRRSSINGLVSGDLINLTLNMLQFTLILRVLGQMLFDFQIRQGVSNVTYAYLAISVIYLIMPAQALVNLVNQERFLYQKLSYSQAEGLFKNTYENDHILFNTLKEDRQEIYKNKIRSKQQRNQIAKNLRRIDQNNRIKQQIKFGQKF